MIKTLESALEYIHWLGSVADVCTYRQTGQQCIGCRCKKFKANESNGEAPK